MTTENEAGDDDSRIVLVGRGTTTGQGPPVGTGNGSSDQEPA